MTPPEPPPGAAVDGDVDRGGGSRGAERERVAGGDGGIVDRRQPRGAVQALLENPFTDLVYFYKNLNGSLTRRRGRRVPRLSRAAAASARRSPRAAPPPTSIFDHVVFTRTARSDGFFDFDVVALTAENPVGTIVPGGDAGEPLRARRTARDRSRSIDADDPRRDPSALADLAAEIAAASLATTETAPATEAGVVRHFVPSEHATYPYPYERLAAELDDADSADIIVNPTPSGDEGDVRGGHGALDVTQSR